MKHIFIINPAAGKGTAESFFLPRILRAVKATGVEYEIHRTINVGDGTRFVKERCQSGESLRFYACGGDGTLNEVVSGAVGCFNAEVGLIPAGTGNDFVRNFGDIESFRDIERQIRGTSIKLDVIRYSTDSRTSQVVSTAPVIEGEESGMGEGQPGNADVRYAVNMINAGLDCAVVGQAARLKRFPLIRGAMAYGLGAAIEVARETTIRLELEFSGGEGGRSECEESEVLEGEFLLIAVGNGAYYGGGFCAAPEASLTDGLFDVCTVATVPRRRLLGLVAKYRTGKHLEDEKCREIVTYRQVRRLVITPLAPSKRMELCADGEVVDAGRTVCEVIENGIQFSIPQRIWADSQEI